MNKSDEKLIRDLLTQVVRMEQQDHDHDHDHDHHNHHDHDDEDPDEWTSSLLVAKVTAMCTLFIASTLCGCIPFLLNRWYNWTHAGGAGANIRSALIVNSLLYFGGGVLLCTTFLHLVPEVSESIDHLQDCNMIPTLTFHLPHLLMCIGFFAMFLVEEIIHVYIHRFRKLNDAAQKAFERGRSIRNSTLVKGSSSIETANTLSKQDLIGGGGGDSTGDIENQKCKADVPKQEPPAQHHQSCASNHNEHGHSHLVHFDENTIVSSLRGLLVVLALSVHELFEGLAVGLESQPGRVWYMFGAVSAHKLILAFCVGVELIVTRTKFWLALAYVITFAIVSPMGIGIGIYVSADDNFASAIPSVILQGLASGTLLYVVFFEILSKERSGLVAYVAFVVGFAVMFGLQIATSSSHHHSHGHCATDTSGHHDHHQHLHHHLDDENPPTGGDFFMVDNTEEKFKLIKETTEQLAQALAAKIK